MNVYYDYSHGRALSSNYLQQLQPPQSNQSIVSQNSSDSADDPTKKKRDRFKGLTEDEVLMRMLPDHIVPNLDIVIVSIISWCALNWLLLWLFLSTSQLTNFIEIVILWKSDICKMSLREELNIWIIIEQQMLNKDV